VCQLLSLLVCGVLLVEVIEEKEVLPLLLPLVLSCDSVVVDDDDDDDDMDSNKGSFENE
jgi:cadmium resistance protein CadD (predicted permease)